MGDIFPIEGREPQSETIVKKKKSLGYRLGELIGAVLAVCLIVIIVAFTIGIVRYILF